MTEPKNISTKTLEFDLSCSITYHWSGKFKSPNAEWMHLTRKLLDFELFVVTSGTLYIALGQTNYTVRTGEYLLMPPGANQHGYRASDCSFYWLHFIPENTSQTSSSKVFFTALPEQGELAATERIVVLMKQLQDSDRRYGMSSLNNSLTSAVLAEISAQCLIKNKYTKDSATQLFNDISDYINWHVCENIRVADIADYFGYNGKYLSAMFKKWSGSSIKQYIIQVKMDHAKAELTDTNHSISQIGYSIGYNDPHNFANAFKKATGLTPGDYRKSYSKRRLVYQ